MSPRFFRRTTGQDSLKSRTLSKQQQDQKLLNIRSKQVLKWIDTPLKCKDGEPISFHPRHEANTVELFFDLFFVANLATFTAYHSITDRDTLLAYIGLFAIMWWTWAQITLHDVRFGLDTIYERICKFVQFVVFVGFALVGSNFAPRSDEVNNTNYRLLCVVLFISRMLLAIQYSVVLFFSRKQKELLLPLSLNIITFVLIAAAFLGIMPAFKDNTKSHLYYAWYIAIVIESFATLTVSSVWRMLSFKETHLGERMGLLTLIVIGEGVIGVTKTVGKMMGGKGVDFEGTALIGCIVLILIFLWQIYFDNNPYGHDRDHFGTIREQFFAALHFPLHLAIVGVVEGSQQIALARFVARNFFTMENAIVKACMLEHLDGKQLVDTLWKTVKGFQLDKKIDSQGQIPLIVENLFALGNVTGICSVNATKSVQPGDSYPDAFLTLMVNVFDGLFQANGAKLSKGKTVAVLAAFEAYNTIYILYFSSVAVMLSIFLFFLWFVRRHKSDIFDYIGISTRATMALLAIALSTFPRNRELAINFISSPMILPLLVIMLFIIICGDRIGRVLAVKRLERRFGIRNGTYDHGIRGEKQHLAANVREVHVV